MFPRRSPASAILGLALCALGMTAQVEVALATPTADGGAPISLQGTGGGNDSGCAIAAEQHALRHLRGTSVEWLLVALALRALRSRRQ